VSNWFEKRSGDRFYYAGNIALMKSGFTFVEVLIALLVVVILVSVACSSLITSLKAEQLSDWQRDASFLVNRLATEARLGTEPAGVVTQAGADWEINSEDIEAGTGPDAITWRVWILYPRERPSLTVTFCSRM
jgi:prepilin-type N-terminal cleavage/methylation domain-containing protein